LITDLTQHMISEE